MLLREKAKKKTNIINHLFLNWDDPEGWYGGGKWEGGSGLGTRVHPWQIHVDVWQNQYNIVK